MLPAQDSESANVVEVGEQARLAEQIRSNYTRVVERIAAAAERSGRNANEITLVAVSKGHDVSFVEAVYRAGHRDFGENRPEEGSEKTHAARKKFAPEIDPIQWHMIGHVQSRKARLVAADFDYVHSIDSVKLSRKLAHAAEELGRTRPVLLECNVSGEESKYGFPVDRFATEPEQWTALSNAIDEIIALPNLSINGLMTMAPIVADLNEVRLYFRRLVELQARLVEAFPAGDWQALSMGMTDDFEVAIEEGATIVRVGRAIFGERL